jgi:uncharacterized protein involved in exopolysaccharide biosynthesis
MNIQTNFQDYWYTFRIHYKTVIGFVLMALILGSVLTFFQVKEYRAESRVVLVQQLGTQVDVYSARRSIEATVELILSLVYSDDFFNRFTEEDIRIRNNFPEDREDRNRLFARNVKVISEGSGIIRIETYDRNKDIALSQNRAALDTLEDTGRVYFGDSDSVNFRVIDQPSLDDGIGRPNIWLNLLFSILIGWLIGAMYVFFQRQSPYTFTPRHFRY